MYPYVLISAVLWFRLFRQYVPFFKVYTMYVRQYERGMALMQDLITKRPLLKNFIALQVAICSVLAHSLILNVEYRKDVRECYFSRFSFFPYNVYHATSCFLILSK